MEGIVVGVDESPCSAAALRWAVDQGTESGQPVTAVLAWGYLDQHHVAPDPPFDPAYSAAMATKVLGELVARALGGDNEVTRVAVCDLPARALLEASPGAAMIVVGARGMGGFRGLLLGSVSRKVLHHATCPVAVIRDDPLHREAPIVVGVDGSEPSQRALEWAVEHARNGRLGLTAVRAWQPPSTTYEFIGPVPYAFDLAADVRRDVQRQLDGVDAAGLVAPVQMCVVQDQASAALLDAGSHASMLVVGSRGHGQLAGMLLGSVSDQVSHHATCPVIVVP